MKSHRKKLLRFKRMICCILAACIISIFVASPAYAIPSTYNTDIPMTHQVKTFWCWAASGASIVNYYGGSITQYNFSTIVKGNSTNNSSASMAEELYGLSHYGLHTHNIITTISYQDIQYNSYNLKRPVIVGLQASAGSSYTYQATGHMLVITGYMSTSGEPNTVILMDPWYYSYQYVTYSSLVSNSDYYWYETVDGIY